MPKLDLKKELKEFYSPSARQISVVEVPPLNYLMIDGHGDPNTAVEYAEKVSALYRMAYTLKFMVKKTTGIDFSVMPLQGLWWVPDMTKFDVEHKEDWDWTMMILQPSTVTAGLVADASSEVLRKLNAPYLDLVRFAEYHEGLAVQVKYFGAYADEGPTIQSLHTYIEATGHELRGKHHEIYLNDPRRTEPHKLATIIRQPMALRSDG